MICNKYLQFVKATLKAIKQWVSSSKKWSENGPCDILAYSLQNIMQGYYYIYIYWVWRVGNSLERKKTISKNQVLLTRALLTRLFQRIKNFELWWKSGIILSLDCTNIIDPVLYQ